MEDIQLKKKWLWIGAVIIIILVAIPFIINESYKAEHGYITVWNGSDLLSFYGSVLGAAGTIVLGFVAYLQNIKLHKSQKEQENKKISIETFALFDFSNFTIEFYNRADSYKKKEVKCFDSGFNGNVAFWKYHSLENMDMIHMQCNIKNIGLYPAVDIYIGDENGKKIDDSNVLSSPSLDDANDKKYIVNGNVGTLIINVDINKLNSNKHLEYYLIFKNPFGCKYSQKVLVYSRYPDHSLIEINAQGNLNQYMLE